MALQVTSALDFIVWPYIEYGTEQYQALYTGFDNGFSYFTPGLWTEDLLSKDYVYPTYPDCPILPER